jgi:L-rhamnose mutarotase
MSKKSRIFGSLIRLKPEYEERYIILHKNTFPGVLKRIYESNIRNYSIFLCKGILFSYFEYIGRAYKADMDKMAQDTYTQRWWKLTDQMQEPLECRKKGEWWTEMEEVLHFQKSASQVKSTKRTAFYAEIASSGADKQDKPKGISTFDIQNLTLFSKERNFYAYIECGLDIEEIKAVLKKFFPLEPPICWHSMKEVFHI